MRGTPVGRVRSTQTRPWNEAEAELKALARSANDPNGEGVLVRVTKGAEWRAAVTEAAALQGAAQGSGVALQQSAAVATAMAEDQLWFAPQLQCSAMHWRNGLGVRVGAVPETIGRVRMCECVCV